MFLSLHCFQHAELLDSLSSLSLPDAHATLLQPSVMLGKARKTQRQILDGAQLHSVLQDKPLTHDPASKSRGCGDSDPRGCRDKPPTCDPASKFRGCSDISGLVGTAWGRKRRRRKLKAEKQLLDPKPSPAGSPEESLEESESGGDEGGGEEDTPESAGEWFLNALGSSGYGVIGGKDFMGM